MKKLALAVLLSLVLCGNARAQNLFTNGGFEDGTTGWTNFWAPTGSSSTERFHSGKSSAQIAHAESKESGWSQSDIKGLEAGAVYKAEVYAYRDTDKVSAKIWLYTGWWHTGAPRYRSTTGRLLLGVNTWELLTGEIPTNPDGTIGINLYVAGKGNVWFDDVSLTLIKTREERKDDLLAITTSTTAKAEEKAQAHLDLGQIALWIEEDSKSALKNYRKALELVPDDKVKCITAFANLAEIYRQQKDHANALASYNKLLDLDPQGAIGADGQLYVGRKEVIKAILGIAETFSQKGDFDNALAGYEKLLESVSGDKAESLKVLHLIAEIHRGRGDHANEAIILKKIADLNNLFTNPGFEDGTTGWTNFWAPTGSSSTERFHSGKSSAQIAHAESKESGWSQSDIKGLEAGAVYKAEVYAYRDTDKVSAKIWLYTGWWHTGAPRYRSTTGRLLLGVNTWELLTGEIPTNPDGTIGINLYVAGKGNVWFDDVSLTLIKTREERKDDLLAITTSTTATAEEKAQAHLDLGQIAFWADKDLESALANYQKTLELVPADQTKCITAFANLAEIHRQQKDYANALTSYNRLLELDPQDAVGANGQLYVGRQKVLRTVAEIYRQQKDYANALASYNRLLEFVSNDKAESRKVLYKIYGIYRQQKDFARATATIKKIADDYSPAATTAATVSADPLRWRLLSDNLHYDGPKLSTGMTYTWDSPPANPADVKPGMQEPGRRLLDGDEVLNLDTTTGWDFGDNAVTFDFRRPYQFAKVRLNFHARLPEYVDILGAEELAEPPEQTAWKTLARMDRVQQNWNELIVPKAPRARYIRLFIKLREGELYFREAQFIGFRSGEATPVPSPAEKRMRKGSSSLLVLADGGQPHCSVVVDQEASREVTNAAWFLRDTLSEMAGCEIPIFDVHENPTGVRLVVGNNTLAEQLGVSVAQEYPGQERYLIRRVGNDIILLGNDAVGNAGNYSGTPMAVMDFLQRLGCGWFRPDPLWHVIPRTETVTVPPELNVDEQPDFLFRQIYLGKIDPAMKSVIKHAWRLGGFEMWIGHILGNLVPDHLRKAHPDWFGPGQPCLTNPEVQQYIVDQFREKLDTSPGQFIFFSLSANDGPAFCQCANCQAAGNVSARSMRFANNIADALRETHPGRFQVGFIAYWVTCAPPSPIVKGKPEVVVMLVDNHELTKPRDATSEQRSTSPLLGWMETGSLTGVYEWWIPACNDPDWQRVPWYSGEAALRNLRYWKEHGIRYVQYETGTSELGDGFPTIRWPLYYIGARGAWDSSLRADDIMREACDKLYGKAAEPMFQFYRTIETAMLETPYPGSLWGLPAPERAYPPETEAQATTYLERAAEMTDDAAARARIIHELEMWSQARQILAERNAQRGSVKTVLVGKPKWRNVPVVKTYRELPYRYEVIGLVEVPIGAGRMDQQAQDKAVEELKRECVQLGANGLLLTERGEEASKVSGKAIYVIED